MVQTDQEIIQEEYKAVYKDGNISQTEINEYLNDNLPEKRLNENEKKSLLEGEIAEAECKDALNGMKLDKAPGGTSRILMQPTTQGCFQKHKGEV